MTQYKRNDTIYIISGVHRDTHGVIRDERDGFYLVYMTDNDKVVSAWIHYQDIDISAEDEDSGRTEENKNDKT